MATLPQEPPNFEKLAAEILAQPAGVDVIRRLTSAAAFTPAPEGRYRHWDTLRHLKPPDGLSIREWWLSIKLGRKAIYRPLPLVDTRERPFVYAVPDALQIMLSEIEKKAAGAVVGPEQVRNPHTRDTYIVKSLMEEAITSSQLEGASTTRQVAKEMIQTGRLPRDRSEQMIYNNYRAMEFIRTVTDRPLTSDIILELHGILVEKTLEKSHAAGRLRREDEDICVEDTRTGDVVHVPPPADQLARRMEGLCDFANGVDKEFSIHPVVRSILLHFWLAYDHPFVDGNGRTARALFYWSMARQGYWLCEFLSISRIIQKAPVRYVRSFLYTETDENDTTYFLLQQSSIVLRAIDELYAYVEKKAAEMQEVSRFLQKTRIAKAVFNHRQLALLDNALKNPYAVYSIESHRRSHAISYHTSRSDLLELQNLKLLNSYKVGNTYQFTVPPGLKRRLEEVADFLTGETKG